MALTDKLTAIAEAIRAKTGGTEPLKLNEMPSAIEGISTGEDTLDAWILDTLRHYENSNATTLEAYSFYNRFNLESVSFPSVKTTGGYTFNQCTALKSVSLPVAKEIGRYSFYKCSALEGVNFPMLTRAETYLFRDCKAMAIADFASLTNIDSDVFYNCENLTTLILRGETLCALKSTSSFTNTPIASGTGYVYVPDELVESYKLASNWSTYANQIKPLSEYVGATE